MCKRKEWEEKERKLRITLVCCFSIKLIIIIIFYFSKLFLEREKTFFRSIIMEFLIFGREFNRHFIKLFGEEIHFCLIDTKKTENK